MKWCTINASFVYIVLNMYILAWMSESHAKKYMHNLITDLEIVHIFIMDKTKMTLM